MSENHAEKPEDNEGSQEAVEEGFNVLCCLICSKEYRFKWGEGDKCLNCTSTSYASQNTTVADILSSLKPIESKFMSILEAVADVDKRCLEITLKQETLKATIEEEIQCLHEALDKRKHELLSELHDITKVKLERLSTQKHMILGVQNHLSEYMVSVNNKIQSPDFEEKVPKIKKSIAKNVDNLHNVIRDSELEPAEEENINFISNLEKMLLECQQFGKVYTYEVCPWKCIIHYRNEATVGEKSSLLVDAMDFNNEPSTQLIKSLECLLVSKLSAISYECDVKRKHQSQYEISFRPTQRGAHHLIIKIEGTHVSKEPIDLNITLPIKKLDCPYLEPVSIEGIERPWGIALSKNTKEIVVTESYQDCISIISMEMGKLTTFKFGMHTSPIKAELSDPRGVVIDKENNLLVVDKGNCCVRKFTMCGKLLAATEKIFSEPIGIGIDLQSSKIYVTDLHCIRILSTDLVLLSSFGEQGAKSGQLWHPRDVTCSKNGLVYVADSGNHRIQVFSTEGKFVRKFSKKSYELNCPSSICVDDSDNLVYVCESGKHCITIFTTDGRFVSSIGKCGSCIRDFNKPCGIALDEHRLIYVCDFENNRLQII